MSGESTSTNMSMPIPGVGVTSGPDYATDVNNSLTIIDSHDHSPGKGVQITPLGLNINSNLSMSNNDLTSIRTTRFSSQNAAITSATPDIRCLYAVGTDLYYNDASGNQIRITASGSVNAGAGSIGGLPSGTASVTFDGASTYVFQSATNTSGSLDGQNVILRNNTALSKGLTLSPPAAMGADYTITLPSLPASTKILRIGSSGTVTASLDVDNSTIEISANNLQLKDGGITNAKVASNAAIAYSKLALTNSIVNADIYSAADIDGSKLANTSIAVEKMSGCAVSAPTITNGSTYSTSYVTIATGTITAVANRPIWCFILPTNTGGDGVLGVSTIRYHITGVTTADRQIMSSTGADLPYVTMPLVFFPGSAGSLTVALQVKSDDGSTISYGSGILQIIQV